MITVMSQVHMHFPKMCNGSDYLKSQLHTGNINGQAGHGKFLSGALLLWTNLMLMLPLLYGCCQQGAARCISILC